ncbi:hypothetical protein HRR78_008782 [Exophiala dermatitidis]|nr:hypothetical protein HRR75_008742 [Exophiala dermatitidis]KAJ4535653.1 hypothetical protein HRR78_008782 [Exophiala dermatitidis]
MVKAANILNIPIYITTQNAARLGPTVSELTDLLSQSSDSQSSDRPEEIDKTAFSMLVPDLLRRLPEQSQTQSQPPSQVRTSSSPSHRLSIIITGIETHICVTQTALDLLDRGHRVYILQDGVSSCNAGERPVALNRLAREGCIVTTSESILFELLGDAKHEKFKAVSTLIKETKEETRVAVETLCKL